MKKYSLENLNEEANRCLICKNPRCKNNCPISTPIPEIITLFKENKIEEAGKILFENNPLSAICAIVCRHENQCLGSCIRGIKGEPIEFYEIEKHISGKYLEGKHFEKVQGVKDRIAIIGSGPAGIALAFILIEKGYKVTIFEKEAQLGGVLRYGIPDFRLPRTILDNIENQLLDLGVKIKYNTLIGPITTVDKLFEDGYKAIFIGTGVWNPKPLNVKGESLGHVHYAINYLKSPNLYKLGKKVIVIGAGNVAMDAARTAKRNGAEDVIIIYRKTFEDMPASKVEIEEAKEDNIQFDLFKSPVEIVDEGAIFIDTKYVEDESRNKKLVNIIGSEKLIEADSVIIAVSQSPKNNIVSNTEDINTNRHGLVVTDEFGHTTREGVFAAGDVVTGARTVVEAVANAKKVAEAIEEYCFKSNI